ncbi:MAG: hypothetical protein JWL59_533 [Chthoniobacteraceae bacterium]|nr:hypothetical protein [Chthoniobacteraceae bacterium]
MLSSSMHRCLNIDTWHEETSSERSRIGGSVKLAIRKLLLAPGEDEQFYNSLTFT